MKKGIAYIRISDEDQSNFSIEGQTNYIREYCSRYDIELLQEFVDEGYSAKNFNRPAWNELKSFLKSGSKLDFLIIFKYDRLIRNTMQGLSEIEELEKKYNLAIISVQENLGVDPYSPYFFKMRTDLLVHGEFERRIISDRVSFGIHTAIKSGRYLHQAPYGYRNSRDEQNKPIIIQDPIEAPVVNMMYQMAASGCSLAEIHSKATEQGYNRKGNSTLARILRNPLYMGMVNKPAYKGKAAELCEGIHEAIVSKDLWYLVQRTFNERPSYFTGAKIIRDDLPLRGFIRCPEGHVLTGHMCRGRHGTLYPFYRCKQCTPNGSYSGLRAHEQLESILQKLSIPADLVFALEEKVKSKLQKKVSETAKELQDLQRDLKTVHNLIANVQDEFFSKRIDIETFDVAMTRYKYKATEISNRIESIQLIKSNISQAKGSFMMKLVDLKGLYLKASVLDKIALLRFIFPGGLTRNRKVWQTPFISTLFPYNEELTGLLEINGKQVFYLPPTSGPGGSRTRVQTRNF